MRCACWMSLIEDWNERLEMGLRIAAGDTEQKMREFTDLYILTLDNTQLRYTSKQHSLDNKTKPYPQRPQRWIVNSAKSEAYDSKASHQENVPGQESIAVRRCSVRRSFSCHAVTCLAPKLQADCLIERYVCQSFSTFSFVCPRLPNPGTTVQIELMVGGIFRESGKRCGGMVLRLSGNADPKCITDLV